VCHVLARYGPSDVCHILARYGHTEGLRWLIETTGDDSLTVRTLRGATPLHYAAITGHLDTLRLIYSYTWIDTKLCHLDTIRLIVQHLYVYHRL